VAVRLTMADGWHTYWTNPGDAGLPTKIRWQLPEGFRAGPIQWPFPSTFRTESVASYGYDGEVWLLNELTAAETLEPGTSVPVAARVEWLQCKDLCIQGAADLAVELPVRPADGPSLDPSRAEEFLAARARLPRPSAGWDVQAAHRKKQILVRAIPPADLLTEAWSVVGLFPQEPAVIEHAAPQSSTPLDHGYLIEVVRSRFAATPPPQLRAVLVLRGPQAGGEVPVQAVELQTPIASKAAWK